MAPALRNGREGRGTRSVGRFGETKTAEITAPPVNLADCSDSWYHAAAIEDANNERDH